MSSPNNSPPSYGTDGAAPPVLPIVASQLQIIFEWVGLLPLVIYLAGTGLSHRLVGQTALAGFISVSLFPRLGVLDSVAAFLREGADFLDRASSISELRRTVWDASFGSVFPCANGAASDILTKHVIRTADDIEIPDNLAELADAYAAGPNTDGGQGEDADSEGVEDDAKRDAKTAVSGSQFRRYQTLYILDCTVDAGKRNVKKPGPSATWSSIFFETLFLLGLLGCCAVAVLFGLYGTAAAIIISAVFRVTRLSINVVTPPGYLENNEPGQVGGYMLVALHENSSTWYLYRGSRAVIDGLLNKPMILGITARPNTAVALTLRALALLQLITMTYVAAQKGWDGVGLLALIVVAWTLDYVLYNDDKLAATWLKREHVTMKAWRCQFSGRTAMLGAIQLLKDGAVSSWMDQILAPSDRREAWLKSLPLDRPDFNMSESKDTLKEKEEDNQRWVKNNWLLTRAAVNAIRICTGEGAV
ncbi:hypothetical protein MKX08_000110 [Trichoderma sp. CBMAI-0020]|nr:hypothetical protein MKX08_000110 [Trichoderma sp. CBMAI-0020]